MRLLFYTATAVFLVLAGIFAFYAMQSSDQGGIARVVLSIDANERPPSEAESERLRADVKDVLARSEAQLGDTAQAESRGDQSDRLPQGDAAVDAGTPQNDARALETPQPQVDERPSNQIAEAAPEAPPSQNAEAAPEQHAAVSDRADPEPVAIPGTTLYGIDNNDPFAKPETAETQADTRESQANSDTPAPAETAPAAGEQQVASLRGSTSSQELGQSSQDTPPTSGSLQAATPAPVNETAAPEPAQTETGTGAGKPSPEEERKLRANFDAFLAAHNERQDKTETENRVAATPPPLPPRRQESGPVGATDGSASWTGRQVALKLDKPKPQAGRKQQEVRVAILLRGVGRDDRNSNEAVTKLPPAISLAFMPFVGSSQQWARKAKELGHEVIVQLPLEPSDYPINNPGAETLLTSASGDDNLSKIGAILSRFENYSGVSNYLGGKLLQSETALRPIVQGLKTRGLIYVGEGNNSHGLLRKLAGEVGLRYGGADMMIDAHPAPEEIRKSLERLVELARKEGSAIGMGYASKSTIEQLQTWSQTLAQQGIVLVPVGALAQTPGAS
jgi:polysaccharide deacetylase 2 family uncharacterized protein YibQ